MRAGEQEAIAETRSLLPLGVTRDVTRIAALFVVSSLRGDRIDGTVADDIRLYTHKAAQFSIGIVGDRDSCTHSADWIRSASRGQRATRSPEDGHHDSTPSFVIEPHAPTRFDGRHA
jgi:hypothetical protein